MYWKKGMMAVPNRLPAKEYKVLRELFLTLRECPVVTYMLWSLLVIVIFFTSVPQVLKLSAAKERRLRSTLRQADIAGIVQYYYYKVKGALESAFRHCWRQK